MIINNMEEFGKALDAGKEMEELNLGDWGDCDFDSHEVSDIKRYIEAGRIRTKTSFYRAWKWFDKDRGELEISNEPFPSVEDWLEVEFSLTVRGNARHLFDYILDGDDE